MDKIKDKLKSTVNNKLKYYQGFYKPINAHKYIGDINNIVYRSSLEYKFMTEIDKRNDILKWASEELYVPYISPIDNRIHRYFIDFIILVKEYNNVEQWYAVEVKPYSQTIPPQKNKNKTKRFITESITYGVNLAKWEAAIKFCESKNWKFVKITEKELYR